MLYKAIKVCTTFYKIEIIFEFMLNILIFRKVVNGEYVAPHMIEMEVCSWL